MGPVVAGLVVAGPVVAGLVVAGPVLIGPVVAASAVAGPVVAGLVVAGLVVAGLVVAGLVVAGPVLVGPVLVGPAVVPAFVVCGWPGRVADEACRVAAARGTVAVPWGVADSGAESRAAVEPFITRARPAATPARVRWPLPRRRLRRMASTPRPPPVKVPVTDMPGSASEVPIS